VQTTLQIVEVRAGKAVTSRAGLLTHWHLLSLDAPTVAVVWTWFIGRVSQVALSSELYAAMFVAVWLLYAVDRLLDTAAADADLEARHFFHHRHRHAFANAIAAGCLMLAPLLLTMARMMFLLYCGVAALLLVWFSIIHCFARDRAERLPKELAVGIFFSAAAFLPGWFAAKNELGWLALAALCFGLLCTLNCLSIYAWEHEDHQLARAHITTRGGVRALRSLDLALIGASLGAAILAPQRLAVVFLATASSAGLLLALDHRRSDFHPTALRATADLVLLTPLLFAAFVR
jgi:hypothetical protein